MNILEGQLLHSVCLDCRLQHWHTHTHTLTVPSLYHIHSWKHDGGISCVVCNKTFQILMGKQLSTLLVRSHQLIPQGCMQRQKTLVM